jgi:hypothetical protein
MANLLARALLVLVLLVLFLDTLVFFQRIIAVLVVLVPLMGFCRGKIHSFLGAPSSTAALLAIRDKVIFFICNETMTTNN